MNRIGPGAFLPFKGRTINDHVPSKGVSQDSLEGTTQAVLVDHGDRRKGVRQVSFKDQAVVVEQSDRRKGSQGNFHRCNEANR